MFATTSAYSFTKWKFSNHIIHHSKKNDHSRQKGGDLTQSYDKSPYTNRNVKGTKWQHKQR